MRKEYSNDEVFKRFLNESAMNEGEYVADRFLSRALSYEIGLLRNELNILKTKILSEPYLIPCSFLSRPSSTIIECEAFSEISMLELSKDDRFVSDSGMVFTPLKGEKIFNNVSCNKSILKLENIEYKAIAVRVTKSQPLFEIVVPNGMVLYDISAKNISFRRVINSVNDNVDGIILDLAKRVSEFPIIKVGMNNDTLAPHCENIIKELDFINSICNRIEIKNDSSKLFYAVEVVGECMEFVVNYSLCSVGKVKSGEILKYDGDAPVMNRMARVVNSVECRYSVADFGAAFRGVLNKMKIWSKRDIEDVCMTEFAHVLNNVVVHKGSFVKHGRLVIAGIVVKLFIKVSEKSDIMYWRDRIEDFLVNNSPVTYSYLIVV